MLVSKSYFTKMICPVCEVEFTKEHSEQHLKICKNLYKRTKCGDPKTSSGLLKGECEGERSCFTCLGGLFSFYPSDGPAGGKCMTCGCWYCIRCKYDYNIQNKEDSYKVIGDCPGCKIGASIQWK